MHFSIERLRTGQAQNVVFLAGTQQSDMLSLDFDCQGISRRSAQMDAALETGA